MVLKKTPTNAVHAHFVPLSNRLHSQELEDLCEETCPETSGTDAHSTESNTRKFGSATSTGHGIMHKFRNGVIIPLGFSTGTKRTQGHHWIKVEISNIMQLFDTIDQMPFRKGQLDAAFTTFLETEAEAAFLSRFRPRIPAQFALRVVLQELPLDSPKRQHTRVGRHMDAGHERIRAAAARLRRSPHSDQVGVPDIVGPRVERNQTDTMERGASYHWLGGSLETGGIAAFRMATLSPEEEAVG
ncbi:hypothetical protein SeLEV6574_g01937 [Synchytrium endobioticum]|nr:hypothetical protein SeLEV6574_g01937 [Synchytrium endobioticum]